MEREGAGATGTLPTPEPGVAVVGGAPGTAAAAAERSGAEPRAGAAGEGREVPVRASLVRRLRRHRPGLRARTTLAFALGALVISVALSVTTYQVARANFIDQRKRTATQRAFANLRQVTALVDLDVAGDTLRDTLQRDANSNWLVFTSPSRPPLASSSGPLRDAIPAAMSRLVEAGNGARQMVEVDGSPVYIVGLPIPDDNGSYYELTRFDDLETPLSRLATSLAVAAALATVGAAILGNAASRRVVRPLAQAAQASQEIAAGQLDTRLEPTGDLDLDSLVAAFNDMAASLQQRIEREARFVSDVSHELRTPLTAMSTAAQLLRTRRDELSERAQTALDVLMTQVEHFERLVLDLLEISRFDAGAAELHVDDVDLTDLVRQVCAVAGQDVPLDHTRLSDPVAGVDKRRVERILANLLQNAALYAGGATRVVLEDEYEHDAFDPKDDLRRPPSGQRIIRLAVEDEGSGVPDDERELIFQRFARGRAHALRGSAPKGTGLGLALVAEHARLHGGRAWVEPGPEKGSRFLVEVRTGEVDEND